MIKAKTIAFALTVALTLFQSCRTMPDRASVVTSFDLTRYVGKWYEVARIDNRFEKNLSDVTATYSLRTDGLIKVDNRGFDAVKQKWKQSVGKAKLAGKSSEGKLKVSFFGPFYSPYNVIAIDERYQYALVGGKDLDYLWLLSRDKAMPERIVEQYLAKAREIGYDTGRLIWVKHRE